VYVGDEQYLACCERSRDVFDWTSNKRSLLVYLTAYCVCVVCLELGRVAVTGLVLEKKVRHAAAFLVEERYTQIIIGGR